MVLYEVLDVLNTSITDQLVNVVVSHAPSVILGELYWTQTIQHQVWSTTHIFIQPLTHNWRTFEHWTWDVLTNMRQFWESRCKNLRRVRVVWDLRWAARQLLAPAGVPLRVVFSAGRAAALVGCVQASSVRRSALRLYEEERKTLLHTVLHVRNFTWTEQKQRKVEMKHKTNCENRKHLKCF